jgi:hypothetical protein
MLFGSLKDGGEVHIDINDNEIKLVVETHEQSETA